MNTPHVVIVGAGFAGVAARSRLLKAGYRVTLIDQHPYNTFQPLLYQVATGGLNPGDVTFPIRNLSGPNRRLSRYRRSKVVGVDTDAQEVICSDGAHVGYDYLLLSVGVAANYFGTPGVAEYSVSLYTRADALQARDMLFGGFERLAAQPDSRDREFTVVVVGGGPTGVEMAGTLAEMRDVGMPRSFPELDPAKIRVVLVEMAPQLLTPFHPSLQQYTKRQLEKRHVDVRLDTAIAKVHHDRVEFGDGSCLDTDLVVWAAGVGGRDEVKQWGFEIGRGGRLVVEDDYRVRGHDNVFAAGDAAVSANDPQPQLAQPAMQMGKHVAQQIQRLEAGQPTEAFHYADRGSMATIGQLSAIVEFPNGARFTGPLAWLLWIAVHLMYLLGGRNRISTMFNLSARYLTFRRTGAIVGDVLDTPAEVGRTTSDPNQEAESSG
ncbi:NAD(P)/FAD-dependent oxidoreductase [Microlunatus sp. Y2014]|uniref:NAD(P)/FAD-dependent oxidoreductase n=1 Tax=Microlunatus sp. Y2014 TaxID=3418488 RepID=UPI003DA73771